MYIRAAYTPLDKVVIELFSHAFGQRSDQRAFSGFYAQAYLLHKIINLVHCRTNLNFRPMQPVGLITCSVKTSISLDICCSKISGFSST